jgi:hypothetical protein
MDSREEALLENAADVDTARELSTAECVPDQLERRLRVAVLEVLAAEPEAVSTEEQ